MIVMNEKMHRELGLINTEGKVVHPELLDLIAPGFIEVNGCVFLKSLKALNLNISGSNFPDKTGFECFVNSIHVDDYVASDYLSHALLFVEACFDLWRSFKGEGGELVAIISSDEIGAVVKLHFLRRGESWLGDDLEKYEDAVFCATSSLPNLR